MKSTNTFCSTLHKELILIELTKQGKETLVNYTHKVLEQTLSF